MQHSPQHSEGAPDRPEDGPARPRAWGWTAGKDADDRYEDDRDATGRDATGLDAEVRDAGRTGTGTGPAAPLPPAGWGGAPAAAGWPGPAAPRPGVVPLRPLGLGELLDGSVSVVRRYPRPTLGLAAAVALLSTVLGLLLLLALPDGVLSGGGTSQRVSNAEIGGAAVGGVATLIITALAGIVLSGVITVVVGRAVLGEPLTAGEAWRAVRPRLLPLLALALLTGLLCLAPVVAGAVVAAVSLGVAGPAGLALGVPVVLGGLAAAAYLYVRLSLAAPALVLEKVGVREALRRSGVLVRGSFWRVLGILLLAALVALAVGQVLQVPFVVLGGGTGLLTGSADVGLRALVLAQVGSGLAQTVTAPFTSGVRALLYIDRRIRAEGLDVALAAAAVPRP